ncbi:gpcp-1 [Pristionchus pacificus]|uniref:Uncharacterized protein n=1 Tax=Pristionchus pacificus TaxID=54126 RepID=A0A2A6D047_PRIPA|nr:gpcp-1 [Pristionchus pacificus]|eukprot:PDM83740.1 hypothetical protein PRIPAC_30227 [Pristionchus pacificus]
MASVEVVLSVRTPLLRPWERAFVVGSSDELGKWVPKEAKIMERSGTDRNLWKCSLIVPSTLSLLQYRYFIGYYLEAATQGENTVPWSLIPSGPSHSTLSIHRWECSAHPRSIHPNLLAHKNGKAAREAEDTFGAIDGRTVINDGWLMHDEEAAFFIRIHGKALKFFNKKEESLQYRLKVVPFDVRFREAYSYEERYYSRKAGGLWRESSVYGDSVGALDGVVRRVRNDDPPPSSDLPEYPSFSSTELSVLTREDPLFGEQYANGSIFRNSIDYLVFRTRTVNVENLGFRIELFSEGSEQVKSERLGIAYALASTLHDTYGKCTLPIINLQSQRPIGQINVDFMLACPLKTKDSTMRDMAKYSYARHWKQRRTLEIGHRGCGSSYTKAAMSRENTLHSLQEAGRKGADMVEFDVHLTKDKKVVVFHDFHVVIEVAARQGSVTDTREKFHEIAIKDLKLSQLHRLHFEHTSAVQLRNAAVAAASISSSSSPVAQSPRMLKVTPDAEETNLDHSPFPPLETVLNAVDPHVGFNIEDGNHECAGGYFERNDFCDAILNEVLSKAGDRRIVFSSFDPDICTLISQKQHRFPVLFLVVGATARYEPFEDVRSDCSRLAVNYAAGSHLLGVNFHSEELLKDRTPFDRARLFNLVTFVWGDDINSKAAQEYLKKELKVDALIYDRIGEEESRRNIFLVEREARATLFSRSTLSSPLGSRRSSMEDLSRCIAPLPYNGSKSISKSPPSSASSSSNEEPPSSNNDEPHSNSPPRTTPRVYVRATTMKR